MEQSDLPNVYVGGLHFKTTKETLIAHFSKFGDVKSAVVITEPGPEGKSKGYGFVNYFNVDDRDKALAIAHELDGRPLSCSVAKESNKNRGMGGMGGMSGGMGGMSSGMGGGGMGGGGMGGGGMYGGAPQYGQKDDDAKKVFIGGLHANTETHDIDQILSEFGKVNFTIIKKDRDTQRSRGFGFVTFDKAEDAAKARKQQYVSILDKRVEIKSVNPNTGQSQGGFGSYGNGNMFSPGSGFDSNSYQYGGSGANSAYPGYGGANSSNWQQSQGNSWQGAGGDSSWNSSAYGSTPGTYSGANTGSYGTNSTSTYGSMTSGQGQQYGATGGYGGYGGASTTGQTDGTNYW